MRILLLVLACLAYVLFWGRMGFRAVLWYRAAGQFRRYRIGRQAVSPCAWAGTAGDLVLFGRLFRVNPALWLGSWTFHFSFVLVIVRHLRYFMNPVPECIIDMQRLGLLAGYVLPLSALYLVIIRLVGREKYVSRYNLFILGLVIAICITGLLMTSFFRPDLVDVKHFVFGIVAFDFGALPASIPFVVHFVLVLLLLPYLPSHIFTAPFISLEARIHEEERRGIMHEK